jgi:hypothetical protein
MSHNEGSWYTNGKRWYFCAPLHLIQPQRLTYRQNWSESYKESPIVVYWTCIIGTRNPQSRQPLCCEHAIGFRCCLSHLWSCWYFVVLITFRSERWEVRSGNLLLERQFTSESQKPTKRRKATKIMQNDQIINSSTNCPFLVASKGMQPVLDPLKKKAF